MAKYKISVCRIAYAFNDVIVEADTMEKAKEIALDEAGDNLYSEKHVDYETQDSIEIE